MDGNFTLDIVYKASAVVPFRPKDRTKLLSNPADIKLMTTCIIHRYEY